MPLLPKLALVATVAFLIFNSALAFEYEDLFAAESAVLEGEISGEILLSKSIFDEVKAELYWFPKNEPWQKVQTIDAQNAEVSSKSIIWKWSGQAVERKEKLSYFLKSRIKVSSSPVLVDKKIRFPLDPLQIAEEARVYLEPTSKVDSESQVIKELASKLAKEESDEWRVVSKIAEWVRSNIDYDLSTLGLPAKQKASEVLKTKKGVCRELTALFIAMLRSIGIPTRFVAGIAFTNAPEFENGYSGHAWAEVYFPTIGWVPWDVTYGQHGWIDAGHIKLAHSKDPDEPTIKISWRGREGRAEPKEPQLKASVIEVGARASQRIRLVANLPVRKVGIGSAALLEVKVINPTNGYVTRELKLSTSGELSPVEKGERLLVLAPGEETTVFWKLQVSKGLSPSYKYELPLIVYSDWEKAEEKLEVDPKEKVYSLSEVTSLASLRLEEEKKPLSQSVELDCVFPEEFYIDEARFATCHLANKAGVNLRDIDFCLAKQCKRLDVQKGLEVSVELPLPKPSPGRQELLATAKNELVVKSYKIAFTVLDRPRLIIKEVEHPSIVNYGKEFVMIIRVEKTSFSNPLNLRAYLLAGKETLKELGEAPEKLEIEWKVSAGLLKAGKNELAVKLEWEDSQKKKYYEKKEFQVFVQASFFQKVLAFFKDFFQSLVSFGK